MYFQIRKFIHSICRKTPNAHSLPHTHMLNFSISNQFNINSILILIKLNAKQFLKIVQSIFHRYHHTTVGLKSLCLRTFYVYNWFFLVAKWNKLEKKKKIISSYTDVHISLCSLFFLLGGHMVERNVFAGRHDILILYSLFRKFHSVYVKHMQNNEDAFSCEQFIIINTK